MDNLYALSALLDVPMNDILVAANVPYIHTMSGRSESAAHPFDPWARGLLRLLCHCGSIIQITGQFVIELVV